MRFWWFSTGLLLLSIFIEKAEFRQHVEQRFKFVNSDVYVQLIRSEKLQYQIIRGSKTLQTVTLDNFSTSNNLVRTDKGTIILNDGGDTSIQFQLIDVSDDVVHVRVSRENLPTESQPTDCFDLDIPNVHWFGGPEDFNQYWPIERCSYTNYSYLTKEDYHAGVAERYWVNSNGVFIYVEETTPLFIEQSSMRYENQLCLRALNALPYNTRVASISFNYHIGIGRDAKTAHMYAVRNILGLPKGYPDERMVQYPIWSTWALYRRDIDDQVIRNFANDIDNYGFNNSQLDIDDDWEDCYGAMTFRKSKFPNIKQLTTDLKEQGFRVTLWIHPFINKDCTEIYNEAKSKGYLVLDHNGSPDTKWWNSAQDQAAYLDFTKSEVKQWFVSRLKRIQEEDGIDSFKFDAGETSWTPDDPVLQGSLNLSPSQITIEYVRTVSAFGPMIEIRTGQGTQDLPVFMRMIDKDSEWNWNNGLITLIPTLLQMNMNGYPFVLPDMIGGNGYDDPPSKELFIRWLQANVFMPTIQFSFVPWMFNDTETIEISKKFTALHSKFAPYIIERFQLAAKTGEPVNPPLWWADPSDKVAQGIYDQFLLGDDIIAAPVVRENSSKRNIYLPQGQWQDGNTLSVYKGPRWLMDYNAPLDTLPYFVRLS